MKIGVFGGTFNPIHTAHINMAAAYINRLQLDKLIVIPTFIPPHKQAENLAAPQHRLEMCRLAVASQEKFCVSDYEIQQQGKSYTYKTLQYLSDECKGSELYLLMGADMFLTVQDWREPQEIYRLAVLCAAQRNSGERELMRSHKHKLEEQGARCILLDMPPVPMSSTQVREKLMSGDDVTGLVSPAVLEYIIDKRLYIN